MDFVLTENVIGITTFVLFGMSNIVPLVTNQSYRKTVIDHLTFRDPFGAGRFAKHPIIMLIQFASLIGPFLIYTAYLKYLPSQAAG